MGNVVSIEEWRNKKAATAVVKTFDSFLAHKGNPKRDEWVNKVEFTYKPYTESYGTSKAITLAYLEEQLALQKQALHTSRDVQVREDAAIMIGQLNIKIHRLRTESLD